MINKHNLRCVETHPTTIVAAEFTLPIVEQAFGPSSGRGLDRYSVRGNYVRFFASLRMTLWARLCMVRRDAPYPTRLTEVQSKKGQNTLNSGE